MIWLTLFFLSLSVLGNSAYSQNLVLTELIERVHSETNSATVYFIKIDQEFLTEFLLTHSQIPVSIISDKIDKLENITTPVVLVTKHVEVPVLKKIIANIEVRNFVVVSAQNLQTLQQHFSFFHENKFTRIFGVANNKSYVFLPYATNKVRTLSKGGLLPNPLQNLNGFSIRTTIQKDIPRTFPYIDKKGQTQVGGCFGQLFAAFLRHHNITYKNILLNNSSKLNIPAIRNATLDDQIDISFNAHPKQEQLDYSYPVKIIEWVIMAPINGHVSPHEYFRRPFTPSTWIFIGLALVYITLMQVLLNKCLESPLEIWQSFSQTFLTMLMLSSEKPIPVTAYRLYLQIFVFSFIIGNIYVIFFTSFLTAFIQIKQFDSMDDLVENNFPILVSEVDWKHIGRPNCLPREVKDLYVKVDHTTYYKELFSMKNTSFAYTLGNDRRDFLIEMQASLMKPLFRKAREVREFYFVGYILPFHSPFKGILNDFVIRVKETGLMLKWDADVVRQAQLAGFKVDVDRSVGGKALHVPLNLRHFEFLWKIVGVGWLLAILTFLGEKLWNRVYSAEIYTK